MACISPSNRQSDLDECVAVTLVRTCEDWPIDEIEEWLDPTPVHVEEILEWLLDDLSVTILFKWLNNILHPASNGLRAHTGISNMFSMAL